ncbi:hypothetical protein BD626DRAFT_485374 [Schizophyllum amplum]|uniref:Uncharacterized protein n=1 Tax=Schizophyllum amplum TaxID=97359 RepID=A0A550CR57_9AGAR|nr:hypothetical protein BD626DRAFT_485374 [Auriculariopsis ampla]
MQCNGILIVCFLMMIAGAGTISGGGKLRSSFSVEIQARSGRAPRSASETRRQCSDERRASALGARCTFDTTERGVINPGTRPRRRRKSETSPCGSKTGRPRGSETGRPCRSETAPSRRERDSAINARARPSGYAGARRSVTDTQTTDESRLPPGDGPRD